jgi:hypothetical protein
MGYNRRRGKCNDSVLCVHCSVQQQAEAVQVNDFETQTPLAGNLTVCFTQMLNTRPLQMDGSITLFKDYPTLGRENKVLHLGGYNT